MVREERAKRESCISLQGRVKRPLTRDARPDEIADDAESQRAQPDQHHFELESYEQEQPADQGNQRRKRVQPYLIRTLGIRPARPQDKDRADLADELDEDSG